jgi:hypothetical protein
MLLIWTPFPRPVLYYIGRRSIPFHMSFQQFPDREEEDRADGPDYADRHRACSRCQCGGS